MRLNTEGLPTVVGLSGLGALAIGVIDTIAWKNLGVPISAVLPYTLAAGLEFGAATFAYFLKKTEVDYEAFSQKEPIPEQTRKAGLFAGVMNATAVAITGGMLRQPLEALAPFTGGLAILGSRLGMKFLPGKNANEEDMDMAQKAVNFGTIATNVALLLQEKAHIDQIGQNLTLAEHGNIALGSMGLGLIATVSPYIARFLKEYGVRIEASQAERIINNPHGAMVLGERILKDFNTDQEPMELNKKVDQVLDYIGKVINPSKKDLDEMWDIVRFVHIEYESPQYGMAAVNKVLKHKRYVEQVRNSVGYNNEVAPSVGRYVGDLLIVFSERLMRKRILKLAKTGQSEIARKERRERVDQEKS